MGRSTPFLVLCAVLVSFAASPRLAAQACDPLTLTFVPVGQGCTTGGSRTAPGLHAQILPGLRTCVVRYTFDPRGGTSSSPTATLLIGLRDPQLRLRFAPGCILRVTPRVLIPMSWNRDAGTQSTSFVVRPGPELIGLVFFAQAVWLPHSGLRLSNGVRTDIS